MSTLPVASDLASFFNGLENAPERLRYPKLSFLGFGWLEVTNLVAHRAQGDRALHRAEVEKLEQDMDANGVHRAANPISISICAADIQTKDKCALQQFVSPFAPVVTICDKPTQHPILLNGRKRVDAILSRLDILRENLAMYEDLQSPDAVEGLQAQIKLESRFMVAFFDQSIVFELVHKNLIVAEDLFTHFHLGEPGTVYRWTGDLMNTWNTCLKVQGAGSPDHQDVLAYAAANDTIFDLVQNQLVWRLLCEITAYDAMAAKPTQIEAIAKSLKSPHIQITIGHLQRLARALNTLFAGTSTSLREVYTSELEKDFEEIYRQTTFLPGSTETMTKHSARLKIKLNAALWKHLKQTAPGSRLKEGASEPIIAALTAGGNLLAMTLRPIADDSIEWTNSGDKGLDMLAGWMDPSYEAYGPSSGKKPCNAHASSRIFTRLLNGPIPNDQVHQELVFHMYELAGDDLATCAKEYASKRQECSQAAVPDARLASWRALSAHYANAGEDLPKLWKDLPDQVRVFVLEDDLALLRILLDHVDLNFKTISDENSRLEYIAEVCLVLFHEDWIARFIIPDLSLSSAFVHIRTLFLHLAKGYGIMNVYWNQYSNLKDISKMNTRTVHDAFTSFFELFGRLNGLGEIPEDLRQRLSEDLAALASRRGLVLPSWTTDLPSSFVQHERLAKISTTAGMVGDVFERVDAAYREDLKKREGNLMEDVLRFVDQKVLGGTQQMASPVSYVTDELEGDDRDSRYRDSPCQDTFGGGIGEGGGDGEEVEDEEDPEDVFFGHPQSSPTKPRKGDRAREMKVEPRSEWEAAPQNSESKGRKNVRRDQESSASRSKGGLADASKRKMKSDWGSGSYGSAEQGSDEDSEGSGPHPPPATPQRGQALRGQAEGSSVARRGLAVDAHASSSVRRGLETGSRGGEKRTMYPASSQQSKSSPKTKTSKVVDPFSFRRSLGSQGGRESSATPRRRIMDE